MEKQISRRKAIGLIALLPFVLENCTSLGFNQSKNPSLRVLDVPVTFNLDIRGCLPHAIKGICEYYGLDKSLNEINKGLKRKFGEASKVVDGARLLSEFKLDVDLYYSHNSSIKSHNKYERGKENTEVQIPLKTRSYNKHLPIGTIKSAIDKGNPSIIFVDAYSLRNKPKKNSYLGHVVTVIGYDKNNIYLNDLSKLFGKRKLETHIFELARKNIPWEYGIILSKSNS